MQNPDNPNATPDPQDRGVMGDPLVDNRTTHSGPIPGATGINGVGADNPSADAPREEAPRDDFDDFDTFNDNITGGAPGS